MKVIREIDRGPSGKMIEQFKVIKHDSIIPNLTHYVGKSSFEQGLPFGLQIRHRNVFFPYHRFVLWLKV
jgi:hypothetical protein